ncbi:MAG: hypothetical protein N2999_07650, partial [Proteobacteria bacterium]|nr:hypothetical protein [Pseudomonadota bacterium]
ALKIIKRASLALLIVSFTTEGSTKIFDYIALEKKIFVVSDFENARAVNIVKEYGNMIFTKNNVKEIKNALNEAFFNRANITINTKVLEFYNREFQTKQLEYILNSIIEGSL